MYRLLLVPASPLAVLGVCLLVIGLTPSGELEVIYIGVGLAALIALGLSIVPVPNIRQQRYRFAWSATVLTTVIVAFLFPRSPKLALAGLGCLGLWFLLSLAQYAIESRLTADALLRFHVRYSDSLDYVAIFDRDGEGKLNKTRCYIDENKVYWQLRRFALPNEMEEQVEAWDAIARQVHEKLALLDEAYRPTGQGENVRVVFDIEMGGFFYTRINQDRFLFGATLDQTAMNDDTCPRDVERLVRALMDRMSVRQQ